LNKLPLLANQWQTSINSRIGSRSQNPYDWPIAIHLLAKGAINIDEMITKKYPLTEWREAFDKVMEGNEIKVMIESCERLPMYSISR
jgi:threonine dehydrogenase-like Zn-dependent dehydrogenase